MKRQTVIWPVIIAALIALVVSGVMYSDASASHIFLVPDCESYGGEFDTSTFLGSGSNIARCSFVCPDGQVVVQQYDSNLDWGPLVPNVFEPFSCPTSGADRTHCRLVDIDNPIDVGTTFQAEWRGGPMDSLRLRVPGGSSIFLQPLPGTTTWSGEGSRIATFSTLNTVDVGKYFASCFGTAGGSGPELKTEVVR